MTSETSEQGNRLPPPIANDVERAAQLIRDGHLVAFPTETVYGLGGDATQEAAVKALFKAKNRPLTNPLIVHVAEADMLVDMVEFDEHAMALAAQFWPGPLTMVLKRWKDAPLSPLVNSGQDTLAVRIPNHPAGLELLTAVGRPVAAPSANLSGCVSPTLASHVAAAFGTEVAMILEGGPCHVGLESTVIDLSTQPPELLRPGGITVEALEPFLGPLGVSWIWPAENASVVAPQDASLVAALPKSPGQLPSHYAPNLPVRLDAYTVAADEALLAFGPLPLPHREEVTLNLSPTGNLQEAASRLFDYLHRLDASGCRAIAVMPIPGYGLGLAINDRLRRAAGPR